MQVARAIRYEEDAEQQRYQQPSRYHPFAVLALVLLWLRPAGGRAAGKDDTDVAFSTICFGKGGIGSLEAFDPLYLIVDNVRQLFLRFLVHRELKLIGFFQDGIFL